MKVIKYKKIKNKYRVYFDNDISLDLFEDIILKHELLLKKDIDDKKLKQIELDNLKEEIYDKALSYINIKMRSRKEISQYLKKKDYSNNDINETIKRLEKNNLINDNIYAKAYVSDKFNLSSEGPLKIKNGLINGGIDENLASKYVNELKEEDIIDKLDRLVDKKIKTIKNYSGNVLRLKITSYFYYLGYYKSTIDKVLDNKNLNNNDNGIKEYNKLLNKYSKKYSGYELESFIRNKLYQKGFDLDEIKKNID